MRIGIIDLGTNTFNLLIAEVSGKNSTLLYKSKIPVKLGQGGISNDIITPQAINRGIKALKQHLETLKDFKAEKICAFATSAIRSAKNGAEFVSLVKTKLHLHIDVISGEQEAEFIYNGVKQAIELPEENVLIMDIGGGSTEFIIAKQDEILWKYSFKLGVSRIKETFNPSDPITKEETNKLLQFLKKELKLLFDALALHPCNILIGSSGSFDSFADMILHEQKTPDFLKDKIFYTFNIDDIRSTNQKLLKSTYKERLLIPGLIEMRADMIVLAGLFIEFIIDKIDAKQVLLSEYALKEGVLAMIKSQN